jgi:hypothetical protein
MYLTGIHGIRILFGAPVEAQTALLAYQPATLITTPPQNPNR